MPRCGVLRSEMLRCVDASGRVVPKVGCGVHAGHNLAQRMSTELCEPSEDPRGHWKHGDVWLQRVRGRLPGLPISEEHPPSQRSSFSPTTAPPPRTLEPPKRVSWKHVKELICQSRASIPPMRLRTSKRAREPFVMADSSLGLTGPCWAPTPLFVDMLMDSRLPSTFFKSADPCRLQPKPP